MRQVFARLRAWWGAPIIINRLVLFLYYLGIAAVGATVWIASSPTLDHAVGGYWASVWGVLTCAAGLFAAASVCTSRLELLERWASVVVAAMLVSFLVAVAQLVQYGSRDRLAYMMIALVLSILPVARASFLVAQSGRAHG